MLLYLTIKKSNEINSDLFYFTTMNYIFLIAILKFIERKHDMCGFFNIYIYLIIIIDVGFTIYNYIQKYITNINLKKISNQIDNISEIYKSENISYLPLNRLRNDLHSYSFGIGKSSPLGSLNPKEGQRSLGSVALPVGKESSKNLKKVITRIDNIDFNIYKDEIINSDFDIKKFNSELQKFNELIKNPLKSEKIKIIKKEKESETEIKKFNENINNKHI
jgi:hypothetical protein